MREEVKVIELDRPEQGVMLTALNDLHNKRIAEGKSADPVDELIEELFTAPTKKVKVKGVPEKSGDFLGEGGAAERTSFCRRSGETSERNSRRRGEAR